MTENRGLSLATMADAMAFAEMVSQTEFAPKDFRGKPAQSVLPPSIHPNGSSYAWTISPLQCDAAVVTLADLGL